MLDPLFAEGIHTGSLTLERPGRPSRTFGSGEPAARLLIHDPRVERRVPADPDFMLGQTYMEGGWETPDLRGLLGVLMGNFDKQQTGAARRLLGGVLRPLQQWNRRAASRRNVAHHYDIDEWLFRCFLDSDMQYSCAYWPPGVHDLESAQAAKRALIRRKLCLEPAQRVLDIGCGWGGLAIELARRADVQVVGLTLSEEQARVARDRVREHDCDDRVEIRLQDYRDVPERFDRIVSVGMFEHVGARYYDTFFAGLRDHLSADGVALLHTIGRLGRPGVTNPWIRRYIFPGGYIPSLSEASAAIERQGIGMADLEVLRLHYADTLAAWYERFQAVRDQVAAQKGERFCRMWEFYLAASEAAFHHRGLVVFHFQLAMDQTAVPRCRDYLHKAAAGNA